jgi:hypothetical protein
MFKQTKEDALRQKITMDVYRVQLDIMDDCIGWHPEKLAIIRDCFDISAKIASGFEVKDIKTQLSK